jgi:hypothetical protein
MTMVNVYSVAMVSVIGFPLDKHYWPYNTFSTNTEFKSNTLNI